MLGLTIRQNNSQNTPMKYRKLRIAWSVGWGLAAVLLIVLWVRSYWIADALVRGRETSTESFNMSLSSSRGILRFHRETYPPRIGPGSYPVVLPDQWVHMKSDTPFASKRYFLWKNGRNKISDYDETTLEFPTAVLAILFALPTALALNLRSFSLRTLLIATTLVAVVLGLVVWAGGQALAAAPRVIGTPPKNCNARDQQTGECCRLRHELN